MFSINTLLGPVRRIRGNRLYLDNGNRILDLYLDNGLRILSYQDTKVRMYAKNAIEKGITTSYPGLYETRFNKALQLFLGKNHYYIAISSESASWYLLHECFNVTENFLELWPCNQGNLNYVDSASNKSSKPLVYRIRPFLPALDHGIGVFTIPGPKPITTSMLVFSDKAYYKKALEFYNAHEKFLSVTPIQHYCCARSLFSLLRLSENGYNQQHWTKFLDTCNGLFMSNGPYIYPQTNDYETFFKTALEAHVLINPEIGSPSIIPMQYSKGEIDKLVRLIRH
ncbi:TPA: hypothetical protein ENS27_12005 [bacterium]|nr:hypothetical protein [bacterium]